MTMSADHELLAEWNRHRDNKGEDEYMEQLANPPQHTQASAVLLTILHTPAKTVLSIVIGQLYFVQYKSFFGMLNKVRQYTCDEARPLSQV